MIEAFHALTSRIFIVVLAKRHQLECARFADAIRRVDPRALPPAVDEKPAEEPAVDEEPLTKLPAARVVRS